MAISNEYVEKLNGMCPAAKGLKIKADVADVDAGDTLTVVVWGRIL